MTKAQRIAVIALGLTAFLALGLLPRGPRNKEPFLAEAVMPDGKHRLRLLKLVQGPLTYDWKDTTPPILRMLPGRLAPPQVPFAAVKIDGVPREATMFGRVPEKSDGISYVFRVVDSDGEYVMGPAFSPTMTFEESTGFEFRPWIHEHEHAVWGVFSGCRGAIPRRDRRLKIRVADRMNTTKPMLFELDNPFFKRPEQEWMPSDLPATVKVDSRTATLKSFRLRNDGQVDAQIIPPSRGYLADFTSFWLEDATGNRGGLLSTFEPAWKLHAEIIPHSLFAVPADQIRDFEGIAMPRVSERLDIKKKLEAGGVEVELVSIHGGETGTGDEQLPDSQSESPNSAYGFRRDRPLMRLTTIGHDDRYDVLTRLTADGKEIQKATSTTRNGKRRELVMSFKRPGADAKLRVEVAVASRLQVEFLVDPKEFRLPE